MLEQTVKLIFATLPKEIYRDFDHRFKLAQTELDDAHLTLSVDIFDLSRIRVYYYGSNSRSYTVHEEYWNGERFESFSDGGAVLSLDEVTQGRLQSWFYRVFKIDASSNFDIDVEGLDRAASLIFSTLPKEMVRDEEPYAISLLISPIPSRPAVCDIRYKSKRTNEYIWITEESPIELGRVTSDLVKKEYRKVKPSR